MGVRQNSLVMVIVWPSKIEVSQVITADNEREAFKRGALRVELVRVNRNTPDTLR